MSITQPDGYLAMPAAGKGDAVLVLHAWWGLNDTIKALCNRLAEAGLVAFAADLYHGKVTNQIAEAKILSTAVDENPNQTRADVAEAARFLMEMTGHSSLAVIGFSLGAYFAVGLSLSAPESVRSVVLFYGTGPGDFSQSHADYLGHFAENDEYEPPEYARHMEEALKSAGRPVNFYTYTGTRHWFFEPDRVDVYNPAAAKLAWDRTLAFLQRPKIQ